MKALTVRPPWSHAIAWLGKTVECRSWRTWYRGELAIVAGVSWSFDGGTDPRMLRAWTGRGLPVTDLNRRNPAIAHGAVVAVVDLTGCHDNTGCCQPWGMSIPAGWVTVGTQWHWELANVWALRTPVPCRGAQGLWTLPDDVERKVREALPAEVDR